MTIKRCAACDRLFEPRPQAKEQTYCPNPACQRERRRRSQIDRRNSTLKCADSWTPSQKQGSPNRLMYWRQYRERNPVYAESNRNQQRARNRKRREEMIANEAASTPISSLSSGRYTLSQVGPDGIANEAVWIVEITVISMNPENSAGSSK